MHLRVRCHGQHPGRDHRPRGQLPAEAATTAPHRTATTETEVTHDLRPAETSTAGSDRLAAMTDRLWHGGAPDLRPGDLITPQPAGAGQHLIDGCPTCEARRAGQPLPSDDNNPRWVYITTDSEYARLYAHGYPRGALYQVEPIGELHDRTGTHDRYPSWGVDAARVLTVYDPVVVLSPNQERRWLRMAGLLPPKGLAG